MTAAGYLAAPGISLFSNPFTRQIFHGIQFADFTQPHCVVGCPPPGIVMVVTATRCPTMDNP
jgi:hypothetical protein